MIRKLIITTILLTSVIVCVFAEDYSVGMTPEQQKQYLNNFLWVSEKLESSTYGFGSVYPIGSFSMLSYSGGTETSIDWNAYCGSQPISKSEFFKIAGDEKLYLYCKEIEDKIAKKHKTGMYLTVGGGVGVCVGFGVMIYECINDDSKYGSTKPYIAALGVLASCIPLGIGICNLRYKENPNISTSFAIGIADLYNQSLSAQIKIGW